MESVAETSEEFMDRYFDGDEFSVGQRFRAALRDQCTVTASIVPVCMGSPINLQRCFQPCLMTSADISRVRTNVPVTVSHRRPMRFLKLNYDFAKSKSAYVWKTIVDPFLGKYSLIKVASGVIKSDDTAVYNVDKEC